MTTRRATFAIFTCVLAGQALLAWRWADLPRRNPPWVAIFLFATAALLLLRLRPTLPTPPPIATRQRSRPSWLDGRLATPLLLTAIASLTAWLLWRIPQLGQHSNYTAVTLAWLLAFTLTLITLWPHHPTRHLPTKEEWQTVGLATAVALFLRLANLENIPYTLGGDEASQGLEALRVLAGDIRNPFTTGWLGVPTMSFFFNSLSLAFAEPTAAALRWPWALLGTTTVLVSYWLGRRVMGPWLGLLLTLLIATYHVHIHFSRLGSNQIADPFFLALALFFLYRALHGRRLLDWGMVGLITGLAFYFYAGARLTLVIITAVVSYHALTQRRNLWQNQRHGLLVMLLTFLVVAAPMLQYATRFPNDFNARLNQVGIIQSGWLAREVEAGGSAPAILFDQFQRAFLAHSYYPDRTVWYGLKQPLLDPIFGGFFWLGLFYATFALCHPQYGRRFAPFVAWWWGGIFLGGMLTESPPSSQRLVTLTVPTCFFIALALWLMAHHTAEIWRKIDATNGLIAAVVAFTLLNSYTYFIHYTPQHLYGGTNAYFATHTAPLLRQWPDTPIYFLGSPWMYWEFATFPYLLPSTKATNLPEEPFQLTTALKNDLHTRGGVFVVHSLRQNEIDPLRQAFPQAQHQDIIHSANEQYLGTLVYVPPSSLNTPATNRQGIKIRNRTQFLFQLKNSE